MISEQDKQAILNGAYGVTREGNKVKWLFTSNTNSDECRHLFIEYIQEEYRKNTNCTLWLTENFTFRLNEEDSSDIVGLWKDKPEPFDLEKALAGEPVKLRGGSKAYIKYAMPKEYAGLYPLHGYFYDEQSPDEFSTENWTLEGKVYVSNSNEEYDYDIVSMWKEPEPVSNTVTVTLPRPLKKPKDGMWYINECGPVESFYHGKDMNLTIFNQRVYFNSKEDTQAWFKAMQDSRR